MNKRKYDKEDLNTDLEWFKSLGINENEAKEYILYLLDCERGFIKK